MSKATDSVKEVKWKRILPNLTIFSLGPVSSNSESWLNVMKSVLTFLK